jgi:antitoxin component YwqK of YwqJK toxin-antitoxin module
MRYKMRYKAFKESDGCLIKTWSNKAGLFHHEKLPAYISHYNDGQVCREEYYDNGFLHRVGGPAYKRYGEDGKVLCIKHMIRGNEHKKDGPAVIYYNYDESISFEEFWVSGKFLGQGREGFWRLWDKLNEKERNSIDILKLLSRFP